MVEMSLLHKLQALLDEYGATPATATDLQLAQALDDLVFPINGKPLYTSAEMQELVARREAELKVQREKLDELERASRALKEARKKRGPSGYCQHFEKKYMGKPEQGKGGEQIHPGYKLLPGYDEIKGRPHDEVVAWCNTTWRSLSPAEQADLRAKYKVSRGETPDDIEPSPEEKQRQQKAGLKLSYPSMG